MFQYFKILAANVAILLIGFVVVELCFGNWLSGGNFGELHIPKAVHKEFALNGLYPGPDTVTYKRDSLGFRGLYPSPSEIDILTFGGSTTDQSYITEGSTWQDIMVDKLTGNGFKVNVVNAGIDGQSTYGHLKNFDWWFPTIDGFRPKCMLFYVGINDIFLSEESRAKGRWQRVLAENSILYKVMRMVKGTLLARQYDVAHSRVNLTAAQWKEGTLASVVERTEAFGANLSAFESRLRLLIQASREAGALPVFATQQVRWGKLEHGKVLGLEKTVEFNRRTFNYVDLYLVMQMFNNVTRQVCAEEGVVCLDLDLELVLEDEDYYDYLHNTPSGARKIGEYMALKLASTPEFLGAIAP